MSGEDRNIPKWLVQARKEFCAGTPYDVPADVVTAGIKPFDAWNTMMEKHRPDVILRGIAKISSNLARDTKPEVPNSTVRQKIMNVIALQCNVSNLGLTAREIGTRLNRSGNSVYQYLVDLVDDGLLVRQKPPMSMPSNTVLYRVAGEREAKR
jgi:hypothetical protein